MTCIISSMSRTQNNKLLNIPKFNRIDNRDFHFITLTKLRNENYMELSTNDAIYAPV